MVLPMIPLHDRFGYINNPSFCMINISQTKITLNAFIQVFNRYIMVSKVLVHYDPEVADGKKIVKVSVNRGTGRPYYWEEKGMQPAGVYVRQGTSAAPSTKVTIRQMIKETDGDSYEEIPGFPLEIPTPISGRIATDQIGTARQSRENWIGSLRM